MLPTESAASNRDFGHEVTTVFDASKIKELAPHQLYPNILLFLAHGCPATVLLDFFAAHPDFPTIQRFMQRYPHTKVQQEIREYERKRLETSEKVAAFRRLFLQHTNFEVIGPDLYN